MNKKIVALVITLIFSASVNAGFDDKEEVVIKKPVQAVKKQETSPSNPLPKAAPAASISVDAKATPIAKPAPMAKTEEPKQVEKKAVKPVSTKPAVKQVKEKKKETKKVVKKKTKKVEEKKIEVAKVEVAKPAVVENEKEKDAMEKASDNVKDVSKKVGTFFGKLANDVKNNGAKESSCQASQKAINQC